MLVDLYKKTYLEAGHDEDQMMISVHSHGYVAKTFEEAYETYYPSVAQAMSKIGQERGWGPYTKATYDHAVGMNGALYVGDPQTVAKKIQYLRETLGTVHRFAMHTPVGFLEHDKILSSLTLLGKEVKPLL